jgi:hypothetical protein
MENKKIKRIKGLIENKGLKKIKREKNYKVF